MAKRASFRPVDTPPTVTRSCRWARSSAASSGALLIGLFISSLNPTDPTVGADVSPTPSATATPTATPTLEPSPSESLEPTPEPTPELPGTVVFGTELDGNRQVIEPVDTFTPGMVFAHSISSTEPFGAATIGEQVVRLNDDGTDGEEIVAAAGNQLGVDPAASTRRLRGR